MTNKLDIDSIIKINSFTWQVTLSKQNIEINDDNSWKSSLAEQVQLYVFFKSHTIEIMKRNNNFSNFPSTEDLSLIFKEENISNDEFFSTTDMLPFLMRILDKKIFHKH
jgi:hypothetical protein